MARIGVTFFAVDLSNPQMWEYGTIARNLLAGNGYQYTAITQNVPSAYMPPGIPFIYYFLLLIFGDSSTGYIFIIFLNILVSLLALIAVFKLSNEIYGRTTALLSAAYVSFSPIFIYSSTTFSAIVYFHFFSTLCFLFFLKSLTNSVDEWKYAFMLALALGSFIYIRAEILLFALILFFAYLFKRKLKLAVILLFVPLIMLAPWTIRNHVVFGTIVPITTSTGYNFYLGHGDDFSTIEFNERINSLTEDSSFEIRKSKIGFESAFNYIKHKPIEDISEALKRIVDLWGADRYRNKATGYLYLSTWFTTLILFIIGIIYSVRDHAISSKLLFLKIFIIFVTALVVIFFNIPRYQIQVSYIMIPTAMFSLNIFLNKLKSRSKQ